MENLNEFILSNRDALQGTFDRLILVSEGDFRTINLDVPNNYKQAALCSLYNHILNNYGKIKGQLGVISEASENSIVTSKLSEIFDGKEPIPEKS